MQIGLVDRLRGVRFFWWIGNIGVKGAKYVNHDLHRDLRGVM